MGLWLGILFGKGLEGLTQRVVFLDLVLRGGIICLGCFFWEYGTYHRVVG